MSMIIPVTRCATPPAPVVSCGRGASTTNHSPSNLTPVVASAAITGFGSVYVNGPHFRTSSAIIRKNGKTVEHSRLAVREIARVKGPKGDADNTGIELTGSNSTLQVLGTAASLYTAARVLPVVGREDLRRRTRRSESGSTCTKKNHRCRSHTTDAGLNYA